MVLRTCTHTVTRTRHTQRVHEWPLIGWKNARSRVCRRRVCEVMVSTSFYGLALQVYLCVHVCEFVARVNAHTRTRATLRARNRLDQDLAVANNYTCPIRHAKLLLDSGYSVTAGTSGRPRDFVP